MTEQHDKAPLSIGIHRASMQGADVFGRCRDLPGTVLIDVDNEGALVDLVDTCDALFLNSARYTPELAQRLASEKSKVRWLQFSSAGYETAEALGVPANVEVTNGGSAWSVTVAEHAMALALGLLRGLPYAADARLRREWNAADFTPPLASLESACVGILGYGDIGRQLAERLAPFRCEVVAIVRTPRLTPGADRQVLMADLDALLPQLDVLVLALPLNSGSVGLIDARRLACLKPSAVLINVGRGASVVEADVVDALRGGALAGFATDVAAFEPLAPESPLWDFMNVIITPHIAAAGGGALGRLVSLCRDNIVRFRDGEPLLNRVQLQRREGGSPG
jgi:phosphoglycerate dehydrogenase-like enzyme